MGLLPESLLKSLAHYPAGPDISCYQLGGNLLICCTAGEILGPTCIFCIITACLASINPGNFQMVKAHRFLSMLVSSLKLLRYLTIKSA